MFTLFLRKDAREAEEISDEMDDYQSQVQETLAEAYEYYAPKLATPQGLLLCFGAGCALTWFVTRHPQSAKAVASSLFSLAKNGALLSMAKD